MGYLKTYSTWLPYKLMTDKRGFISLRFGNGHTGIDSVGNEYANKICAVMDGKITKVVKSTTLGNCVYYGAGGIEVAHYHLSSVSVKVGSTVEAGKTAVGVEGSTGTLAKGKHLHTSIWINGVLVDPEPYLCGDKELLIPPKKEAKKMYRRVIKELNLRRTKSTVSNSNIVKALPVGTILEVIMVDGEWGHVIAHIGDGTSYHGYSKIASTWSEEVSD